MNSHQGAIEHIACRHINRKEEHESPRRPQRASIVKDDSTDAHTELKLCYQRGLSVPIQTLQDFRYVGSHQLTRAKTAPLSSKSSAANTISLSFPSPSTAKSIPSPSPRNTPPASMTAKPTLHLAILPLGTSSRNSWRQAQLDKRLPCRPRQLFPQALVASWLTQEAAASTAWQTAPD